MDAAERISTFALVPVSWPAESAHRAVNFFDYLIDGVPLRDIVPTQDIGVLGFDPYDEFTQLMAQQLLPPVASIDGRLHGMAQIYGCRECCDLDCGAVIVRISRQGNAIRWESIGQFWAGLELREFPEYEFSAGPYVFDYSQYFAAFRPFIDALEK